MIQLWRSPSGAVLAQAQSLARAGAPLDGGWLLLQPEIVAAMILPERPDRSSMVEHRRGQLATAMSPYGIVVADPRVALAYVAGAHQTVLNMAIAYQAGDPRTTLSSVNSASIAFGALCRKLEPVIPEWVKRGMDPPKP